MRTGHRAADVSVILVALAALCWGLSGGVAGILIADGWNAPELAFYRGAIGLLFVFVWLTLRQNDSGLADRRLWFWSGIAGFGMAGNFAFYFISIESASVAVAATLMYCAPVYVYLLSFALRIESSSPLKWLALGAVLVGIVLLTGIYKVGSSSATPFGVAAGLLSGLCYAIFILGFRNASVHGSLQAVLLIEFTSLVSVLIWPVDPVSIVAAPGKPGWPLLLVLGLLGAGVSFFLYVLGIRRAMPTTASMVAMVEPITASLFGVAILNKSLTIPQLLGMTLILVTVTALSVNSST